MPVAFDLSQVVQFVPSSNNCSVDAIVRHPDDTSRIATEGICVCFGGPRHVELIIAALEYYRKHHVLQADAEVVPKGIGGWLVAPGR